MEKEIQLEKYMFRKRKDTSIFQKQLKKICKPFDSHFSSTIDFNVEPEKTTDGRFRYVAVIKLNSKGKLSETQLEYQFNRGQDNFIKRASFLEWYVTDRPVDTTLVIVAGPEPIIRTKLPPLTEGVYKEYFAGIYEREPHIRTIYASLQTAEHTDFVKRRHILLYGPPAAAKTRVFLGFEQWLGPSWVQRMDATTLTSAGLGIKLIQLSRQKQLPPILYIEEIEKTKEDNVASLLSIMDQRGSIQRTNARTINNGMDYAETKVILWATCNNLQVLTKMKSGALASRFSRKLRCCRPSKNLMNKILYDEAKEIGMDKETAKAVSGKVMDFMFTNLKTNDPREGVALLDYGEQWLKGTPKDIIEMQKAEQEEKEFLDSLGMSYEEMD